MLKGDSKSALHRQFKDKAKNRVDDLQGMISDLQDARKESRTIDVALLEEQVNQMLREWKAELNQPTPEPSLNGCSLGSFSSDICRLLQIREEEDDAISPLKNAATPKSEPVAETQEFHVSNDVLFQEEYTVNQLVQQSFHSVNECEDTRPGIHDMMDNNFGGFTQLDFNQFDLSQDFGTNLIHWCTDGDLCAEGTVADISRLLENVSPPPAAFLGPKCALWDCPRPAQGSDWCRDYCNSFHATLALNEGPPGMTPVLRPGGIGLKDGLFFAALIAKNEGKYVGIPECEGAATAKSPWNAPELFDLTVLEGETLREWLFFDKPRRAFESGNRKQRSLPDYSGRGWHESRKQVMNEYGGQKRSYYMDPQPVNNLEWHLYEYEDNKCDVFALYRLELKLVDGKKNARGKTANDSVAALQKQMGRLTAAPNSDKKRSGKGRTKIGLKGNDKNTKSGMELNDEWPVKDLNDYYLT